MFSRYNLFLFFNTGLTPAKFPKSLTDNIGGFNSGSASSLSIARQGIDSSTHRPNTPSQSHSSSPFLPGCYQRKALSPRIQSPIMRNSSYLGQSKCGNDMQQHIKHDLKSYTYAILISDTTVFSQITVINPQSFLPLSSKIQPGPKKRRINRLLLVHPLNRHIDHL